jgi:hypothetical protein
VQQSTFSVRLFSSIKTSRSMEGEIAAVPASFFLPLAERRDVRQKSSNLIVQGHNRRIQGIHPQHYDSSVAFGSKFSINHCADQSPDM